MRLGSLVIAMGYYHLKRMLKNPYYFLWLLLVTASIYVISTCWLPQFSLSKEEWIINCASTGMLGAYLGLPLIVRSFSPAFAVSGGAEFLGSRTSYVTYDIVINTLVNVLALCWWGAVGMAAACYLAGKVSLLSALIYPIVTLLLPAILLLVAISMVLWLVFPALAAVIIFWLIFLGMAVFPGLAPWSAVVSNSSADLSPLMVVNRLFYLTGAGLLIYIYSLVVKNQSIGVSSTRLQAKQANLATGKAVIISGQGLVLGNSLLKERIKKELVIIRYPRIIISWLVAGGCGWLANYNLSWGQAGIGVTMIFMALIVSPQTYEDYLVPEKYRKKWSFIITRAGFALLLCLFQLLIFSFAASLESTGEILGGLIMVGGWACLAGHYWSLVTVRIMASLFWIAVVFFPGALLMTNTNYWWLLMGGLLMILSLILYRRHPYLE